MTTARTRPRGPDGAPEAGDAGAGDTPPRLVPGIPVVGRDAHRVQVGLSTPDAVILTGPAQPLAAFLRTLDGRHSVAEAARRSGLAAALADRTIQVLDAAGLLAGPPPIAGHCVKIVGLGLLGTQLARHLHAHGVSLWLTDEEPADRFAHPHARAGAGNADATAAELAAVSGAEPARPRQLRPAVQVAGHWAKPDDLRPDLTVVATDRPECDRMIPDELIRADQPHLILRGLCDGAVVGPVVHPGHGPCLRCCDLTRRDLDPEWPTVLRQLCRTPGRLPAAPAAWAAATAATQALAWVEGGRPETLGATIELRAYDWTTRLRRWPVHPECGCIWH